MTNPEEHFIQGMSRISAFWGFPKAMGAIYGVLYLSPEPLSQDDLIERARVSKGTVSTSLRRLIQLGMVHRVTQVGQRKDYYAAETDFWQIVRGILHRREQSEFDRALRTVDESLAMLPESDLPPERIAFLRQRLEAMQRFFHTLDNLVALLVSLDELRLNGLRRWLDRSTNEE